MEVKISDEIMLTEVQKKAYDCMKKGKNIFITGPGGTGKSFLINLFRNNFGTSKVIGVTSTTGVSALLINGVTLHSFLGIGLGTSSMEKLVMKILSRKFFRERWQNLEVLIIDEISMLNPNLFDKLNRMAKKIRQNYTPFGGIQLILSGDFCQLPVVKSDKFCFESKSWDECVKETVYLTDILRQSDKQFQQCLLEIRCDELSEKSKSLLEKCEDRELKNPMNIKPTKIFSTNREVDLTNESQLDVLAEDGRDFYRYEMDVKYYGRPSSKDTKITMYKKNCIAMETLELCIGSQVMLLYNIDIERGLVNGSRGIVVKIIEELPVVKFMNGVETVIDFNTWEYEENDIHIIDISQIPLRLAWAVTIHKTQGSTLDYAEIDFDNIFEYGQAYVALSRIKSDECLSIKNLDVDKIKTHPKAKKYYRELLQLRLCTEK